MDDFIDLDISEDSEDNDYDEQFASESFLDNLENDPIEEEIPNIEDENESEEDDIPEATKWSVHLSEVPGALRISEFGHTYIYGRLKDPDGNPTNKFHGFFKNNVLENSDWKSLPGVLSDRYSVVSLEKFINSIVKPKFENIVEYYTYNSEPWKLAWLGVIENSQKYTIEYIDRESSIILSRNIGNEYVDIDSMVSKFGFMITNTYNGSNKLKISPIIKTNILVKGGTNLDFIDYFTFCNFTQVISHSSKGSDIEDDLIVIKENISGHISVLKEFTDISSIKKSISKCFRKPGRDIFESILNGETRNMLDVSIATSIALGKKYSIIEYLAIRSKIEEFFEQIF